MANEQKAVLQQRLNAALTIPPGDAERNAAINPQVSFRVCFNVGNGMDGTRCTACRIQIAWPSGACLTIRSLPGRELRKDVHGTRLATNTRGFSVFDQEQLGNANNIASELYQAASEHPDAPISAVLDLVEARLADDVNDNEAVRHALMIFVTHSPLAQSTGLKINALSQRAAKLAVPVNTGVPAPNPHEDFEVALNYWREDINLSEHHEHWHIVYPGGGIPDPRNPRVFRPKDRQGELFVFMHQQMLARYNAERYVNGFPPLVHISNFNEPLDGDVPDANLRYSGKAFTPRPNGVRMQDLGTPGGRDYLPLKTLEDARDHILEAIKAGKFRDGTPITADKLGATLENDVGGADPAYYGNLHNMGHVIISYLGDPKRWQDPNVVPGLMYTTRTAVRDPVFWRWHGLIDELFATWQNTLPPNTYTDAPHVRLRKQLPSAATNGSPDVILVYRDVLEGLGLNVADDAALAQFAEQNFGGANWDAAPNPKFAVDLLETEMRMREFKNLNDDGSTETISYVFPREVVYFFRVENLDQNNDSEITLRVSMVPKVKSEDRRSYFEMDKFIVNLKKGEKKVVARRLDDSSVIRKPAQKTVEQMDDRRDEDDGLDRAGDQYCDCGWPFNMVVPRGTPEGSAFRLVVLATDAKVDRVPVKTGCGSLSFCGAKDRYPDTREMGYPFNRPFPSNAVTSTLSALESFAAKDITIRLALNGFGKEQPAHAVPAATPAPVPAAQVPGSVTAPATAAPPAAIPREEPNPNVTTRTLTRTNGDIEIIRTEILPNGSKKITRTIRQKVAPGQKPPFDPNTKGEIRRAVEVDEKTGRKVEVVETVGDDGVRRITRRFVA
ncbi:Polyphenol oxidase 1 [Phlyctochytrium planicorne]|nr:Polyphenol oxidase 1 [Phlyctochytrium planicorne]